MQKSVKIEESIRQNLLGALTGSLNYTHKNGVISCLGDLAVSLIVAKSENELDMETYRNL